MIQVNSELRLGDSSLSDMLSEPQLGAQRVELAAGMVVFEPGAAGQNLYFIQSGQVREYQAGPDDSARLLDILGPGEWFGVGALGTTGIYKSRAVAISPTTVWAVPVEKLLALFARQPGVSTMFIRQLAGKIQAAREDAGRLVFDDCGSRLIKTLLHFSNTAAATPQENGVVMLRITHRQLAQAVGAARETVSLALTQLRQQNLLRTGRNRLVFHPDALRGIASRPHAATPRREKIA
ncbi:MAG: putative cyclic nucleotide-binding domain [Phycisphaerales bacterium]|jgi:CRP-like cAMP-binding protein|nr:putative cyclic nucleotide-binding domain [Phycisphaerales bacterium]MDB5300427.1 putative cyclic nucleotide-binding domain [Phycisphaerales bacterium]MDB5302595.1 putative cyclic nucleotide-binding domain [Phycisphaerales bacterium]